MRNIFKEIILLSGIAALAIGCAKEDPIGKDDSQGSKNYSYLSVYADEGTRTHLDGNAVKWDGNEVIYAYDEDGESYQSLTITVDGNKATFGFDEYIEPSAFLYVAYPAATAGSTMSGTKIPVTIPASQTPVAGSFAAGVNTSVGYVEKGAATLMNVGALVSVQVNSENVKKVTLTGVPANSAKYMVGTGYADMDAETPVIEVPTSGSNSILMDAGTGTFTKGSTYYFVVFPQNYSSFSITFENGYGFTKTYTNSNGLNLSRNDNKLIFNKDISAFKDAGKDGLLPGKTFQQIQNAPWWFVNEYRGGFGNGAGVIDWYSTFMAAQFLEWYGWSQMENEGCALRIQDGASSGTVDVQNFNSYVYGKKQITKDNCKLSLYVRCHNADVGYECYWGVQVIDLNALCPTLDRLQCEEGRTYFIKNNNDLANFTLDLEPYVGHTVVIAIGTYRGMADPCGEIHLVLRKVSFSPTYILGDDYVGSPSEGEGGHPISGLTNWHFSTEMAASITPNTNTEFSGWRGNNLTSVTAAKTDPSYKYWGSMWNQTPGHIASEWGYMYISVDPIGVESGEGFRLRSLGTDADYTTPQGGYFYSKFKIDDAHDTMKLWCRTFGSWIGVGITAIKEDGTYTHVAPSSCTASDKEAVGTNNIWKFHHEAGAAGATLDTNLACFTYDLSAFKGQNVTICICAYNCAQNDGSLVIGRVVFE